MRRIKMFTWAAAFLGLAAAVRAGEPLEPDDGVNREKMQKVTHLGVMMRRPSRALRAHLGLPDGVGLVVQRVEGGSPADRAGLKRNDVLHKLDDQILVNPEQLAVLVRMRKPGDEVKLAVVRKGERTTLAAALGEREVAVRDGDDVLGLEGAEKWLPERLRGRLHRLGREGLKGLDLPRIKDLEKLEQEGVVVKKLPGGGRIIIRRGPDAHAFGFAFRGPDDDDDEDDDDDDDDDDEDDDDDDDDGNVKKKDRDVNKGDQEVF